MYVNPFQRRRYFPASHCEQFLESVSLRVLSWSDKGASGHEFQDFSNFPTILTGGRSARQAAGIVERANILEAVLNLVAEVARLQISAEFLRIQLPPFSF
jgi:hypothetical protein